MMLLEQRSAGYKSPVGLICTISENYQILTIGLRSTLINWSGARNL